VVSNQLPSPRLGVLDVAPHGERTLDAVPRPRVATDYDAHLEDAQAIAPASSPNLERHDDAKRDQQQQPSL
jgi:hypothetical protein